MSRWITFPRIADLPSLLGLAAGVFIAAAAGIELTIHSGRVASFWLANAVVLAVVMRQPVRAWPVWLAAGLAGNVGADLAVGDRPDLALLLSLFNTVEITLIACILRFTTRPALPDLTRLRHFFLFVGAGGIVAPAVSSLLAAGLLHVVRGDPLWSTLVPWYLADALGMLIVSPVVWGIQPQDLRALVREARGVQTLAVLAAASALSGWLFWNDLGRWVFLLSAFIVGAAVMMGYAGAALGTFLTAGTGILAVALRGEAGLAPGEIREQIQFLQVFALVSELTAIPVAALFRETRDKGRLLQTVFDTLPQSIVVKDIHSRMLMVNRAWLDRYGIRNEDAVGVHILDIAAVPLAERQRALDEDIQVFAEPGRVHSFVGQLTVKDGRAIQFHTLKTGLLNPGGGVRGLVGITEDVTEMRDARRTAEAAQTRLIDAIESMAGGFALFDERDRFVVCNSEWRRMFPKTENLLVPGTEWKQAMVGAAQEYLDPSWGPADALVDAFHLPPGQAAQRSGEFHLNDGRSTRVLLYRTRGGGLACLIFDVTLEKRAEEARNQTQRLELIGQLAGGVAHDFNNLLTVIIGNSEALLAELADSGASGLARLIHDAGEKAGELTRRLLAFARKQPLDVQSLDVGNVVRGLEPILQRTLGPKIEVHLGGPKEVWPVVADPALLESALINLAINARDAMPDGGTLSIQAANLHLDSLYAETHPDVNPGDYVAVSVADTGTGMSAEVKARAIEPFFTTKERGKGTGMGLAMIHGFVKQTGGHLEIYSELGQGTTVKLFLPRAVSSQAREARPAPEDTGTIPRGHEAVLVVDDNDLVRGSAVRALSGLGYRVFEAAEAGQALEVLSRGEPVDLLFTDLMLPGVRTGFDLADQAQRIRPGLKVLYTSGFVDDVILKRAPATLGQALIAKPYSRADLARRVREALG